MAGHSLPSSSVSDQWEAALHRYQSLKILQDADFKFGTYRETMRRYSEAKFDLECRYGTWERATADPATDAERRLIMELCNSADEAWCRNFCLATDRAALDLVRVEAPDLAAVRLKMELIEEHTLHEWDEMDLPVMEIIVKDVERLQGGMEMAA